MSRTQNTKQAFAEAFVLLYREKPLEKISVQEITRKAGYNRSTFYQYFFDITDLLEYVEQDLLEYIKNNRKSESEVEEDVFIENLLTLYEEKSIYVDALLGDYGSNHFFERVKAALHEDIPEMNIPDSDPLKAYRMEFRVSVSLSLFRLWIRRGKDLPMNDLLKLVWSLYLNGISSVSEMSFE